MTQQEILDTIAPVIRMHEARGTRVHVTTDPQHIMVKPSGGAFGGTFITDLSNVCREQYIGFAVGAQENTPYILL